jgi:molybdopterin molybdotransferase
MKTIGEALREIVPCFEPAGVVRLPLLEAAGLVLAEDVVAGRDLPGFDNSAMDGYALRHADLVPGRGLQVAGESRAGSPGTTVLVQSTAMRIFTGAPVPQGADTVVIQENTRVDAGLVYCEPTPAAGANVRQRASDLAKGSTALSRGQALYAGEIALLAALGRASASVFRRPRVAILSTGDELRDIGDELTPGTIVSSNAYALATLVRDAGGEAWVLPPAADRLEEIVERLEQGLRADVLLCSGGVSVGDYDLVAQALARADVEIKLWKVAIKPGKPLVFGMHGRVPVLGLPGNPVSAQVTFEIFVRPGLRKMLGHAAPYPRLIQVELDHDHRHGTGRVELARARLEHASDGRVLARLHALQGSGSLPSMCAADALVILAGDVERFARGSLLQAVALGAPHGQAQPPFA